MNGKSFVHISSPEECDDMYVIIVYDIEVPRINKIRKILRKYLFWVQNSVFEGALSDSSYKAMISEVKKELKKDYDSLVIYKCKSQKALKRSVIGRDFLESDFVI